MTSRLTTPHAAAVAGVLFALLFGTALVLIRLALPEGAESGAQWIDGASGHMRVSATLMPFAGIAFLWFIAVVRDGFGAYEDKFFSTVFIGSGLLFLAMMFLAAGVGAGLERSGAAMDPDVAAFGQMVLLTVSKTYALRMAAVFMMSLATIWLKTKLMPRWLVIVTYVAAVGLLIASDLSMWLTLAFPIWVLVVSVLLLVRAGVIDLHS
ncbi:hypothetical protein [Mycolicibacterium bacteremicum]|uniref:DUF4386 domain-containing protein n=1 Tax=Mycolicibacterium bacteremicum TaxID=564198 RepID=A0A1W9YPD6_MYCBA|nr:hypothetical protein [Mycolicibacterium bacteremicum]MCV7432234.1 hypothetical protein [Mycolicibacterium bacteremicum]ORA01660.1 hypothetical protein BST17_27100 [Mycolicibacterium bacteremicum]